MHYLTLTLDGMSGTTSLRQSQLEAILSMLQFNENPVSSNATTNQQRKTALTNTSTSGGETAWKVLVYDEFGQQIISPLLRIADLRDAGVTVHMQLHAERQPIPDVPAIYFIRPTSENISRICQDLARNLYESYYINFSSAVPRQLLEQLAESTIQSGTYSQISQVFDQYLNYLCPEPSMFSLNLRDSYLTLNNPQVGDAEMEGFVNQVVDSLYSIFVTTNVTPIIRAQKGNAAEMVARKLEGRLRDRLLNVRTETTGGVGGGLDLAQRPLLIILDRNLDLSTMLTHTWSYQCLAHDVLDLKLGRIIIPSEENGRQVKKVYDIDLKDFFWANNAKRPFPKMAEDVDVELNKYTAEVQEITKSCGASTLEEISLQDPSMSAKNLKQAITALPRLTERKRVIDMHMNIASALLSIIKKRGLDAFILAEESLGKQTKSAVLDLLKDESKGSAEDKLRLFVSFYLSTDAEFSKEEMTYFEHALSKFGCDMDVVSFAKNHRSFNRITSLAAPAITANKSSSDLLGRFSSKLADNFKDASFGNTLDSLISGVKNILPASQNLPITRVTETLMESGASTSFNITGSSSSAISDADYLYLDPKQPRNSGKPATMNKVSFQEAFVFVVGGGNYVEYQNLQEFMQSSGKRITYGSTEIINADLFLSQLSKLGQGQK